MKPPLQENGDSFAEGAVLRQCIMSDYHNIEGNSQDFCFGRKDSAQNKSLFLFLKGSAPVSGRRLSDKLDVFWRKIFCHGKNLPGAKEDYRAGF